MKNRVLLFLIFFLGFSPIVALAQQQQNISQQLSNATSPISQQPNQPGEYIAEDSANFQLYKIVSRDKSFPLLVFSDSIQQNDSTIGYYTVSDDSWEGKIVKKFTFLLPNGAKAAEAVIIGISKDNCSMQTFQDNEIHDIEMNAIENTARVEILAKFLVDNGYL